MFIFDKDDPIFTPLVAVCEGLFTILQEPEKSAPLQIFTLKDRDGLDPIKHIPPFLEIYEVDRFVISSEPNVIVLEVFKLSYIE
jgi:hypothetical protein